MRAVSSEVTPGSSFVDVGLADPLRCDSAPEPSWCATREISPASVSLSAARWPTRRTACSFSPAVSLGDDGPFARALPVPLLWAVLSWLLPPPTARPSRGTGRRQRPGRSRPTSKLKARHYTNSCGSRATAGRPVDPGAACLVGRIRQRPGEGARRGRATLSMGSCRRCPSGS